MSDEPLTLRAWTDVVRRARLGRTVKSVALMLATYADADGRRVFPGVARVAIDCELGYNAVQAAFAALRNAGLIELVKAAARRGDADEYRLILRPDVLDQIEVLTPTQVKVAAAKLGATKRGRYRAKPTEPDPLHPSGVGADPVDNPHLHPSAEGAEPASEQEPAPIGACAKCDLHPSARATCTHRRDHPPPSTNVTRATSQPTEEVRTQLAVVGDTGPPQDPISPPHPKRCPHGLSAAHRPDGTTECVLCRRGLADVIPIRRRRSA